MSRLRLVLLGVFAVLAVSGVGTGSASAACNVDTGKFVFCDHTGRELGTPLALLLALSLAAKLETHIAGLPTTIECETSHIDITILLLGRTRGNLLYLKCKVVEQAECSVAEPIAATFNDVLVGGMGKPEDEFSGAGAEEEFATLKITGTNCVVKGEFPVKGKQLVEISNGEELLAEHLFVAKKSGSKLKIGVESASYSGIAHDLRLESGLPWRVLLGT
jgi:hypothetical protein